MSCNYRDSFLESDEFYATLLHFSSVLQAPIHIFGIYIILKKTPKSMEKVKFPIIVLHLICAWCDFFVSILTTPVFLFPATAGYPLGILYDVLPTRLLIYMGFASIGCEYYSVANVIIGPSLILLFENRYKFLVHKDSESPSRKVKRLLYISINFLLIILIMVPPFKNPIDVPRFRETVHQEFPCFPEKIIQHPRLYYLNTDNFTVFICLSLEVLIPLSQILTFFFATIFHLFKNSRSRSSRTTQLQNQFFKAMCIQICLPFAVIVVPGLYFLYAFATGHFDLILNYFCMISITSHGAFSTVVMIIVHEPYRSATLQILRIRKKETPISSRTHHIIC